MTHFLPDCPAVAPNAVSDQRDPVLLCPSALSPSGRPSPMSQCIYFGSYKSYRFSCYNQSEKEITKMNM